MGLRKSMGKSYWLRAGLYFGLGLQMLNAAMRKNDIEKNPKYYEGQEYNFMDYTMFGNSLGEKTYLFTGRYDDGRERYLRWGKQFRDFMELIVTPFTKMGSKISPIMQFLPEAMIGYSWSGFKNDDVAGTKGIEHAYGVFKTAVKTPIPFSIKKLVDEKKDFEFTDFFFPSSKGPGKYRIREYYIKAIKKGSERMMLETYESAIRNGLPAYILFGEALGDVNREIADNIAERTKSIGDLEDMRDNEINLRHKHILSKRISRLKMEQADFEHSASKFGSALAKFRHFQTTGSEDIPKGIFN
jgi:hypothetical protein